jgi:hypothetical protein
MPKRKRVEPRTHRRLAHHPAIYPLGGADGLRVIETRSSLWRSYHPEGERMELNKTDTVASVEIAADCVSTSVWLPMCGHPIGRNVV